MEILLFVIPVLICAVVFIGMGMYAVKKKTPMHFFSGTTIKSEEISDVNAYNKANGIMWIVYGSTFILAAIFAVFFGGMGGAIVVGLSSTVGLIALLLTYQRIYIKYRVKK